MEKTLSKQQKNVNEQVAAVEDGLVCSSLVRSGSDEANKTEKRRDN